MSLMPLRSKAPSSAFGDTSCCDSLPLIMTDELFHWLAGLGSGMIRRVA